jgi:hypothetical protein
MSLAVQVNIILHHRFFQMSAFNPPSDHFHLLLVEASKKSSTFWWTRLFDFMKPRWKFTGKPRNSVTPFHSWESFSAESVSLLIESSCRTGETKVIRVSVWLMS